MSGRLFPRRPDCYERNLGAVKVTVDLTLTFKQPLLSCSLFTTRNTIYFDKNASL